MFESSCITLRYFITFCWMVSLVQANNPIIIKWKPERSYRIWNSIASAPYLLQVRDVDGSFMCAGTLIAPQYILSSADCLNRIDYTKVSVVAGASSPSDNGTVRQIIKINKYPQRHINVAVLKLNAPLNNIEPIDLSEAKVDELMEQGDALITIVGWRHLARKKSITRVLSYNQAEFASQPRCELQFYAAGTKKLFCLKGMGYEDEPCVSDVGGPAMFEGEIVGVVSKGHKCGGTNHLTAVTSVHDILPFIREAMQ